MNKLISLAALILLGAAASASAQVNLPDPTLPGSSPQNAVRLVSTSELMVDRSIRRWLRQHYPGWNAEPAEIRDIGFERFAIVNISAANQSDRRVYFLLTPHQNEDRDGGFPPPL